MVIFVFIAFIGIALVFMPICYIQAKREMKQEKGGDDY